MNDAFLLLATATPIAILFSGFLMGILHAKDPDHVAAVSTIVSERESLWSSAIIGGIWGVGHSLALIIAGVAVLLLDFEITPETSRWLEFSVGIMLILLGLNVFRKLVTGKKLHFHEHSHGDHKHVHLHTHENGEALQGSHHLLKFSPRALIVGMVHGLAGSGGLMLAIIPTIDSRSLGLIYILIFGIGSIGGMIIMSLLVGLPFHLTARRLDKLNTIFQIVAGIASIAVGAIVAFENLAGE